MSQMTLSFPLPDKKLPGKCFLRFSLKKSARMYNLCQRTARKISAVKLQNRIPFRQSCSERCQNFEIILYDASKYMKGIPADVGDVIDYILFDYSGHFPDIMCVSLTCQKCGADIYKKNIMAANATKIAEKSKRFMIKQWITKTVKKGVSQSYLDWKFKRCNYLELVELLMEAMEVMAEHIYGIMELLPV